MKKSKLFYLMGIVLLSTAMVFSSCKKDDDPAPAPTPTPTDPCANYAPIFSPTYIVDNSTGIDLLDFYITCTSDDWEMIKVIVSYPGGLGSDEFLGNGQLVTQGTTFTFPVLFPKLGGTWTFAITGNIKSGQCVGKSFTVTKTMTVTGK